MPSPSGMQWIKGDASTAVFYSADGVEPPKAYANMSTEQQAVIEAFVGSHAEFEPDGPPA